MLKDLLGSLLAIPVELVFCAGETIHFRCKRNLTQGQIKKVRAKLPEGQIFGARLQVVSQDAKGELYIGRLLHPLDAIPHLTRLLPLPFEDRRTTPRIERTVRVMSPQIEGYSAMTRDVSMEGLCLVLGQVVSVGSTIQLEIDLDSASDQPLRLELETRWVAPDLLTGKHLVGGRFQAVSGRLRSALKGYLQSHQS